MTNFIPGDSVMSDKYGRGTVTGYSAERDCVVLVRYDARLRDMAYDCRTGRRLPRFGTDTITHEEADDV